MLNNREIVALIKLIDDPDEQVFSMIKGKLESIGEDIIPYLENAWEQQSLGIVFQNRIESIIHGIQFDSTYAKLKSWKEKGGENLLEGAFLISRYQYPDFDEEKIRKLIKQMIQDVWLELNDYLTALEKVKIINHILFDVHGFSPNTTNFHAPQNSYLYNVLESKKGNPISLCIIYLHICKELELPVYGVNLPKHFVMAYADPFSILSENISEPSQILFYINAFGKGGVFSHKDVEHFIDQLKIPMSNQYMLPCTSIDIIVRVCHNLIFSYEKLGYPDKVNEVKKLLTALQ
jgi:hypothetical protein